MNFLVMDSGLLFVYFVNVYYLYIFDFGLFVLLVEGDDGDDEDDFGSDDGLFFMIKFKKKLIIGYSFVYILLFFEFWWWDINVSIMSIDIVKKVGIEKIFVDE